MKGYLRAENLGRIEPPTDGWHDRRHRHHRSSRLRGDQGRAKRFADRRRNGVAAAVGIIPPICAGNPIAVLAAPTRARVNGLSC